MSRISLRFHPSLWRLNIGMGMAYWLRTTAPMHAPQTRFPISALLSSLSYKLAPFTTGPHTINPNELPVSETQNSEDLKGFTLPDMPPRKRAPVKADMDDSVVDDSDSGPQTKRLKTTLKSKTASAGNGGTSTSKQIDAEGNAFWEMGGKLRRVAISKFKGNVFVNIREHYEKDGNILPGKKGISLSIDQFNALMTVLPQVHAELRKESKTEIVTPDFSASAVGKRTNEEGEDHQEEESEEEEKPK